MNDNNSTEFNIAIDKGKRMVKIAILILVAILIPTYAGASWFGPSTYEECVLKNMKGVTSDRAASFINKSCRQQFPEKSFFDDAQSDPIPVRDLTEDEIVKVTGSLSCFDGYYLVGSLHNGNSNLSIISMNISFEGREYDSFINISPLSASDVKLKIVGCKKSDSAWSILKARGI